MDKKEYLKLVKSKSKMPNIIENAGISFLAGGVLGGLYHILVTWLMNLFNLEAAVASGITCVLYIIVSVTLTGFGVFDDLVSKFKFGLIIPITGFAHSVASSLLDAKRDGLITGLGPGMFKLAGAVILYGTVSAFILSLAKVIING